MASPAGPDSNTREYNYIDEYDIHKTLFKQVKAVYLLHQGHELPAVAQKLSHLSISRLRQILREQQYVYRRSQHTLTRLQDRKAKAAVQAQRQEIKKAQGVTRNNPMAFGFLVFGSCL